MSWQPDTVVPRGVIRRVIMSMDWKVQAIQVRAKCVRKNFGELVIQR